MKPYPDLTKQTRALIVKLMPHTLPIITLTLIQAQALSLAAVNLRITLCITLPSTNPNSNHKLNAINNIELNLTLTLTLKHYIEPKPSSH